MMESMESIARLAGRPRRFPDGSQKLVVLMDPQDLAALDQYAKARMWTRADTVRVFVRRALLQDGLPAGEPITALSRNAAGE